VGQTVEVVEGDACRFAVMPARLVSSEGQYMEKRGARRGQPASSLSDGIGSKHYQWR